MNILVAEGLLLLLAQVLVLSIDAQQVDVHTINLNGKRDTEHDVEFSLLEEHLLSVIHLLAQANGRSSSQLQMGSTDTVESRRAISAIDHFVTSLLTSLSALGIEHSHELEDPVATKLVAALSKQIPTKQQEASKYLRIILTVVHMLLGEDGTSHIPGAAADTGASNKATGSGTAADGDGLPRHSYPLLRRAVVARLTQLWVIHLRLHSESESGSESESESSTWVATARRDVGRVLLSLFRLHRAGMRVRAALEFMHISKAAGTSMCHLAGVSGCRAQDFSMGRTCLMRDFDDQPRWINGTHHWKQIATVAEPWGAHPYAFLLYGVPRLPNRKRTCSARLALLEKHHWNFFANEYTIYNNITAYTIPVAPVEDKEVGKQDENFASNGTAQTKLSRMPHPPISPPKPMAPPAPPQSVVFEETAARYSSYVSQLVAGSPELSRSVRGTGTRGSSSRALKSSSSSSSRVASAIMGGAELCPSFGNVIVLRDPAERFTSHLKFIAQTYGTMYKWPSVAQAFAPGRDSAAWWQAFVPPLFDNYMLRSLAGEVVFAMSYKDFDDGAMSYMKLAKIMLAQYDVILLLEVDEPSHRRAVHFGLAWRHLLTEFQLRNSSALMKKMKDLHVYGAQLGALLPNEQLLEQLKAFAVRYDNVLYAYGALLAGLDDVVWRLAAEVLGEPFPGFQSGVESQCGFVRTAPRPPAAPGTPPPAAPPTSAPHN